jgi:hypothetical protein
MFYIDPAAFAQDTCIFFCVEHNGASDVCFEGCAANGE